MCGIAGKLIVDGPGAVSEPLLRRMCDRLVHRGPDDEGYYVNGRIGLGHRRLSIIDLQTGHQPIHNEDRTVWVVLNGEIYNFVELREDLVRRGHRFRTQTDTEILVHLYEERKEGFIDLLRGMFAIALWDERAKTLLLARDRVGKKPLYYSILGRKGVVFASQLDALVADPDVERDIDPEAVDAYLSTQYVPAPLTIYKAARKLPAGHVLRCSGDGVVLREYWDLSFADASEGAGSGQLREQVLREGLTARIADAVKIRLRSDVPLGAFLSGGLDSSVVVSAMADQLDQPVIACTAAFDDAEHDERAAAREVAERCGCEYHEETIRPDLADLPVRVAGAFDEPFADAAAIPNFLIAEAARRYVKVALTGDGGDELFAGYWRHQRARLENRVRGLLGPVASVVSALTPRFAPESRRAGLLPLGMSAARAYAWKHSGLLFDATLKSGLYTPGFAAACRDFDPSKRFRSYYDKCDARDPLGRALYVDFKTSLADGILVKVDRTSMAHGLEVRSPLLDHDLVEFAARVPSSLKLRRNRGKYLLSQVAANRLPRSVLNRPKHGLTVPVARWLREDWRDLAEDCLRGPTATARGFFESRFIESVWTRHLSGRNLYTQHLWTLVMLELWCRKASGG